MTTETFDVLFTNEKNKEITLRDYFANSAMQGLITNEQNFDYLREQTAQNIAKDSYLLADAMLKQREL